MTADGDDFWTKTTSPTGEHVWLVCAWEAKMSHWVMEGRLERRDDHAVLFKTPDGWSFEERKWTSPEVLRLVGRRYPGGQSGVVVTLDVRSLRGTLDVQDPTRSPPAPAGEQPFDALERWLAAFPS